jgi:hypothetical protein
MSRATAAAHAMLPAARALFDAVYEPGAVYRGTMALLEEIEVGASRQGDLFEDPVRMERTEEVGRVIDRVNARYGKHRLAHGPALFLPRGHRTDRDELPERKCIRLPGENDRRRLGFPLLGIRV